MSTQKLFGSQNIRQGGGPCTLHSVPVGTPLTISGRGDNVSLDLPMTVAVNPGSGGSVLTEYRVTESGAWRQFADGELAGTITSYRLDVLTGPIRSIRFTASTSTATVEIAQ